MIFKESDFQEGVGNSAPWMIRTDSAAIIANRKLREWLDAADRVYGYEHKSTLLREDDLRFDYERPHWSARLVCIEPISRLGEERALIRDFLNAQRGATVDQLHMLYERARKLLDMK